MGKSTCAFITNINNYKFAAYQAELFKTAGGTQTEQVIKEPKRSSPVRSPLNLSTGYFYCYYTTTTTTTTTTSTTTTTTTTYNNNDNKNYSTEKVSVLLGLLST